jgi:hypothetical protein
MPSWLRRAKGARIARQKMAPMAKDAQGSALPKRMESQTLDKSAIAKPDATNGFGTTKHLKSTKAADEKMKPIARANATEGAPSARKPKRRQKAPDIISGIGKPALKGPTKGLPKALGNLSDKLPRASPAKTRNIFSE